MPSQAALDGYRELSLVVEAKVQGGLLFVDFLEVTMRDVDHLNT